MKISVIGGGGVRAMFLAKSLAQSSEELKFDEIVFMDNNEKKLNIYGRMAARLVKELRPELNFRLTTDPVEAVRDADYIITTIRVGEDDMRIRDERITLNLGLLGQETTGAAGFSFAMRSVPALARYCELAKKYASKDVKIFNFTNPAGVVSQTLRDMGYDFTFGICDCPSSLLHSFAKLYGVPQDSVTGECYGLNHLSFFESVKLDGREIMPELLADPRLYTETDMRFFGKDLVDHMGCILNEYLYYYYYREEAVRNILEAGITRGEVIRDVNLHMTEALSHMDIEKDFEGCLKVFDRWYGKREDAYMSNETGVKRAKTPYHFDIYEKNAGGYAGVALKYIRARNTPGISQMILCVPNQGAIPGLLDSDVVEITCSLENGVYTPHKIHNPGELQMELIRSVKLYERLASKALRTKSISTAIDCLMVHPLVNSYSLAKELVNAYLESNKEYTEEWN
ncbi:MAG: 6-phospho-beta-glucosidase [Clostridiales bacterium]|nr:6-phospho-beta-glucosidase [Clostridiales bacterium]